MSTQKKKYDLEERTFIFARKCRDFIRRLPKTISNVEYAKQLIRSSSSIAANYIEANDSLCKKDFLMRIRICRKECKESRLWLQLIFLRKEQSSIRDKLILEVTELMKIFGAILEKSK